MWLKAESTIYIYFIIMNNDDSQDVTHFGSSGDDHQAFIDEFDLMISNQDVIQF